MEKFLSGMFTAVLLSAVVFSFLYSKPPVPTCTELLAEEWAFKQCFANQPACEISGYKMYERYHLVRSAVRRCHESTQGES